MKNAKKKMTKERFMFLVKQKRNGIEFCEVESQDSYDTRRQQNQEYIRTLKNKYERTGFCF